VDLGREPPGIAAQEAARLIFPTYRASRASLRASPSVMFADR
jgi:hypothetical protein